MTPGRLVERQARFQQHDAGVEAAADARAGLVDGGEARRRAEYPLHFAPWLLEGDEARGEAVM